MPSVPRVSIVIPTYNRAAMLPRAVNSVLTQTFTDLELLIVDDYSVDNTPDVAASLADADSRIRTFRHSRNRGLAATRNTGIANAQGEYIAFLDDDDEYMPTKLEKQVQALDAASPDLGLAYAWCSIVGPTGDIVGERTPLAEGCVFREALARRLILGIGSSSMIRASVIEDIGWFDESLPRSEDLDFLCRLTRRYKICLTPEILVTLHRGHPQMTSSTRENLILQRDHIKSHQKKFGVEIGKRRGVRSSLWSDLALVELAIGNHLSAYRAAFIAILIDPRAGYLAVKWLLKRAVRSFRK